MRLAVGLVALLLAPTVPATGNNGGSSSPAPPPVVLVGARSVSTRTATGGLQRTTIIPSTSLFATYASATSNGCVFTATHDDFPLTNGQHVPQGTQITGTLQFVQGAITVLPIQPTDLPNWTIVHNSKGPLDQATVAFTVFCAGAAEALSSIEFIMVPLLDPFLDPRTRLDPLRNNLQLTKPTIYTNPIVTTYGGLVTRYPTWLAITPNAWTTQISEPTPPYRGTTLRLIAEPRELDFQIDFTPNPDKPSPPYHDTITCIPQMATEPGNGALPAFPLLPDQTEPGPNGPCMWTPPGPGNVTSTALITYTITFWANGYTEPETDYTWTSDPTTYTTGELTAVNTTP